MLAAAEYSSYGVDRKPLRVTWPVKGSHQRSTYWLSVPYQYGIPIMVLYMILHWLVSESIYYVLLIPYDGDQRVWEKRTSCLGLTALPMLLAVVVGFLMIFLLVALAFRRFKSTMPLAGSCSAAISAACHPPKDDCTDTAALGELMWGETGLPPDWDIDQSDGDDQKGHCSFTSLDAVQPSLMKLYA